MSRNTMSIVITDGIIKYMNTGGNAAKLNRTAYLFDVDGVLSEPKYKVVPEELISQLINLLQEGNPVGLNTGRSIAWINERLLTSMLDDRKDISFLSNFIAIGEKGSTWNTYDLNGKVNHGKAKEIVMPEILIKKVKALVSDKYNGAMFFDSTKETMISIEMHDGYDIKDFQRQQKELCQDLKEIIKVIGVESSMVIEESIIATDIQCRKVGKAFGARRFLTFLQEQNLHLARFVTFGDSVSDLEMADELYNSGHAVSFIFVGESKKLENINKKYPVICIEGYTKATFQYLAENNN